MIGKLLAITLVLSGSISNEYGRIGLLVSHNGSIGKVYRHSPAFDAGLQRGDQILECDGICGTEVVDGIAGTIARITVRKKNGEVVILNITRVTRQEVYD